MTKDQITEVKEAIKAVGLSCSNFPKKLEIRIPKVKFPGVYLNIPTDTKSFKVQMYFHQTSFGYFDKVKTFGYTTGEADLYKTIQLNEVKGIPSKDEVEQYLQDALEHAKKLGVVVIDQVLEANVTELAEQN